MAGRDKLEIVFEKYRKLISDNEQISKEIGRLERELSQKTEEQNLIYGNMELVEAEIRKMMYGSEVPLDVELEDKPEEEVSVPSPKKKKLDVSKASALREAGWSYAKIGQELHVSTQTVCNALNKEKKLKLTEEEKVSCDRFAEELFGGGK